MGLTDFLWAIPVFGTLIFIHELGHFAVAKFFDIRVHEFALGFGPVLAGIKRGETRYNLRIVPLGGFVRMAGMEDGDMDDPRGFSSKSVLARSLVIAAGPVMNFVLAAILYAALLFFIGVDQNTNQLGEILATCDTQVAGQTVSRPCPAHSAGLRSGDVVQAINGTKVSNWTELQTLVASSQGKPLLFTVKRGADIREIKVEPIYEGERYMVGIRPSTRREPLGTALVQGAVWTWDVSVMWIGGIAKMLTRQMEAEFSGPVGITKTIADAASHGMDMLLRLTAFLSINLGLFNLLPIPALDGSRLVFMGVEAVRGRKIDPARENVIHFVGFLILIGLMLVITYKEVVIR